MADDVTTTTTTGTVKDDPKKPEPEKESPSSDDDTDWKAQSRKHEREAKKNADRVKELEDVGKSETQKVTDERDALKGDLTTAQATALRFEIALDKGIPKSIASRLQGATREEMEADADELLKTIGATSKKPPSFDGGAKDKDAPGSGSFLSQALRATRGA